MQIVSAAPPLDVAAFNFIDAISHVYKCTQDAFSEGLKGTVYSSEWEEVRPVVEKIHKAVVAECSKKELNVIEFLE